MSTNIHRFVDVSLSAHGGIRVGGVGVKALTQCLKETGVFMTPCVSLVRWLRQKRLASSTLTFLQFSLAWVRRSKSQGLEKRHKSLGQFIDQEGGSLEGREGGLTPLWISDTVDNTRAFPSAVTVRAPWAVGWDHMPPSPVPSRHCDFLCTFGHALIFSQHPHLSNHLILAWIIFWLLSRFKMIKF